jgi:hypothetical protein
VGADDGGDDAAVGRPGGLHVPALGPLPPSLRLAGFTSGYLLAWAGAGIPAFLLTAFVAQLVDDHPAWATAVAVAVFASCGVYSSLR